MVTAKEYLTLNELTYVVDCSKYSAEDLKTKTFQQLDLTSQCTNYLLCGGDRKNWDTLVNEMPDWNIVGSQDDNRNTGFAGVAFEKTTIVDGVEKKEIVFGFRGTESNQRSNSDILIPKDIKDDVELMAGKSFANVLKTPVTSVAEVLNTYISDAVIGLIPDKGLRNDLYIKENELSQAMTGTPVLPAQFEMTEDFVYDTLLKIYKERNGDLGTDTPTLNQLVSYYNVSFTGHSLGGALADYMVYLTKDVNASAVTFNAVGIYHLLSDAGAPESYNAVDYIDELDIVGNTCRGLGTTVKVKSNAVAQYKPGESGAYETNSYLSFEAVTKTLVTGMTADTHPLHLLIDNIDENDNIVYNPTTHAYVYDENNIITRNTTYGKFDGNDTLTGTANSDNLTGYRGNDILDGKAGNDTLAGGVGNDTYVFGKGYGVDTINNYDRQSTDNDVVKFNEGVNSKDLVLTKMGDNLEVTIKGVANDKLIINNYFVKEDIAGFGEGHFNKVEGFEFADGTKWSQETIDGKWNTGYSTTTTATNSNKSVNLLFQNLIQGMASFGKGFSSTVGSMTDNKSLFDNSLFASSGSFFKKAFKV